MTAKETLIKFWNERNPQHESNADTGEDMFFDTVLAVINDFNASQSKWVSVEERLPEIGQEVLCYYEIEATDSKRKKTGEVYSYKKILYIKSIEIYSDFKQVNWIDSDYNPATPTHWQPLPDKPVEKS